MQVKKQQLHPDMEQWIGSKLRKEYIKAVYFHSTYLIYMHGASWKMMDDSNWNQAWINHKLESRLQGEISVTSDVQMIPL